MVSIYRSLLAIAVLFGAIASSADAALIQLIDMGVPTDGVHVMTGYRGFVIRISSGNSTKIRRVSMASVDKVQSERPSGSINGALAQVWVDPSAAGNYQSTPGFNDARNVTPSVMNFDSHLLGDPSHYVISELAEGAFMPSPNPLTPLSDPSTRFFDTERPNHLYGDGTYIAYKSIVTVFDILPEFRTSTLDLAYVVTGSTCGIEFATYYENIPTFGDKTGTLIFVPEPTSVAAVAGLALVRRRRRSQCFTRRSKSKVISFAGSGSC